MLYNYGLLIKAQFNCVYPRIHCRPWRDFCGKTAHFAKRLCITIEKTKAREIKYSQADFKEGNDWMLWNEHQTLQERSFLGQEKSNCIPGLGVLLEGATLISPLVVYIKRHVFHKEKKKAPPLCKQPPSKTAHAFWNLYLWSAERPIMKMFRGAITANIPTVGL